MFVSRAPDSGLKLIDFGMASGPASASFIRCARPSAAAAAGIGRRKGGSHSAGGAAGVIGRRSSGRRSRLRHRPWSSSSSSGSEGGGGEREGSIDDDRAEAAVSEIMGTEGFVPPEVLSRQLYSPAVE